MSRLVQACLSLPGAFLAAGLGAGGFTLIRPFVLPFGEGLEGAGRGIRFYDRGFSLAAVLIGTGLMLADPGALFPLGLILVCAGGRPVLGWIRRKGGRG